MQPPRRDQIPDPAVRRLSLYLRQLEVFQRRNCSTVSSQQLAESLGLGDAQVRKDLAYFGQFGRPGIGYRVDELIASVKHIFGTDKIQNVALVGAGNLGRALAAYRGFVAKGFNLVAIFDSDPAKLGRVHGSLVVQSMHQLATALRDLEVQLAIIAVPAEQAQAVADALVAAGIRGLLNFAPVSISIPPHVAINSVDLAVQLEQISFRVSVRPGT